jgi:hypothetical protein
MRAAGFAASPHRVGGPAPACWARAAIFVFFGREELEVSSPAVPEAAGSKGHRGREGRPRSRVLSRYRVPARQNGGPLTRCRSHVPATRPDRHEAHGLFDRVVTSTGWLSLAHSLATPAHGTAYATPCRGVANIGESRAAVLQRPRWRVRARGAALCRELLAARIAGRATAFFWRSFLPRTRCQSLAVRLAADPLHANGDYSAIRSGPTCRTANASGYGMLSRRKDRLCRGRGLEPERSPLARFAFIDVLRARQSQGFPNEAVAQPGFRSRSTPLNSPRAGRPHLPVSCADILQHAGVQRFAERTAAHSGGQDRSRVRAGLRGISRRVEPPL